jgi:hypothetical protein
MTMTTSVKTITDCLDDIARNASQACHALHRRPRTEHARILETASAKIASDLALLATLTECTQESA